MQVAQMVVVAVVVPARSDSMVVVLAVVPAE
jgi:hypothetical protein